MSVAVASIGSLTSKTTGTTLNLDVPDSVAVGDLLIAHVSSTGESGSWATPSGWTEIQQGTTGTLAVAAFYKIADSGDAAASTLPFVQDTSSNAGGRMFRITGHKSSGPINTSQKGTNANNATVTVGTITPSVAYCLILFLVAAKSDGATRTCSGYALATSSPSFTEAYDDQYDTNAGHIAAAYGERPQTTATGNATATLSGADPNVGILIAIEPQTENASVTGATGSLALTGNAGAVTGSASVTGSTGSLVIGGNAGTVQTPDPDWNSVDKSATPSWNNPDKS